MNTATRESRSPIPTAYCVPMGTITANPGQIALSIRQKIVRNHSPMVVFHAHGNIYAVQPDTAAGITVLHSRAGNRAWIGTYSATATRTDIRDDLQWWQAQAKTSEAA